MNLLKYVHNIFGNVFIQKNIARLATVNSEK
jgi:hypothetical protein